MRQSNGTDILGANDPRSSTIGILYVFPEDERATVLAAILTQEKLARQIIVIVLSAQNRAFQRPVDFDGLKNMRRTLKAQLVLIAPQGSGPAEFARQRRFTTFSSLDAYAQSLRTGQQEAQPQKRGWLFGRRLHLHRPDNPPASQVPTFPVPQPMTLPPNPQLNPDPAEHVDVAAPPVLVPPVSDKVSPNVEQLPVMDEDYDADIDFHQRPATPNVEQLPVMDEDTAPHTEDIPQPQDMLAHTNEQWSMAAQNTTGGQGDAAAQDTLELLDDMPDDNLDSEDDGDREEEPDPDKTLPPGRFTSQPIPALEPQPVILTPHPSRIPPVPRDSRNVHGDLPVAPASATGRPSAASSIGRTMGTRSVLRSQLRGTRRRWLFALLIVLLLLLIGGGIYTALSVFGTEVTATVTITPVREVLQHTYTISAVTGVPSVVQSQIEARFLSSSPLVQSDSVTASGRGTVPATHATGKLTFYNSSSSPQTLPVNTLVTDAKGIEVITDAAIVVPGAIQPTSGSTTVNAHTINTGSSSNIPANDLNNVQCCAGDIFASNLTAFTGGQDAQTYTYVEQSDIDGAVNQLSSTLSQRAQTGVMGQILPDEQLIGSIGCVPNITTTHTAGDKAANVIVTVTETCSGEVYNQQQAHATANELLRVDAMKNFGADYALSGDVTTTIMRATLAKQNGEIAVLVKAGGVWAYQFSNTEKMQLVQMIVGKNEKAAIAALATTNGIHSVSVQVNGGDGNTLPTDTKQITIVVKA